MMVAHGPANGGREPVLYTSSLAWAMVVGLVMSGGSLAGSQSHSVLKLHYCTGFVRSWLDAVVDDFKVRQQTATRQLGN